VGVLAYWDRRGQKGQKTSGLLGGGGASQPRQHRAGQFLRGAGRHKSAVDRVAVAVRDARVEWQPAQRPLLVEVVAAATVLGKRHKHLPARQRGGLYAATDRSL